MKNSILFLSPKTKIYDLQNNTMHYSVDIEKQIKKRQEEYFEKKIVEGNRVALLSQNTVSFIVDLLAALASGISVFVIDNELTEWEKSVLLNKIAPDFIISSSSVLNFSKTQNSSAYLKPGSLVLFTSGSTSMPKGVVHNLSNLNNRIQTINKVIPERIRQRTFCCLPLHFGHGLIGMTLSSLSSDSTLLLAPPMSLKTVHLINNWLIESKPTFISGTPGIWNLLIRYSEPLMNNDLKRVQVASAKASHEFLEKIKNWAGCSLYNVFGTTETASWISDCEYKSVLDENCIGDGKDWNTDFKILNPDEKGIGQLAVKCNSVFDFYFGEEEKNNNITEGWYKTGDLARKDSLGRIFYVGRKGRIINKSGLKISPEEIELEILKNDGIKDVAVISSNKDQTDLVALFVVKKAKDQTEDFGYAVLNQIEKHLSSHKVPSQFKFVESIPRRSNGKLNLEETIQKWNQSPSTSFFKKPQKIN